LIGQFLLAFREALEAALITAIILAYLRRTKRSWLTRYVWYGFWLAIAANFALGASIWFVYGGLSGPTKALFEGVAARKRRSMPQQLEARRLPCPLFRSSWYFEKVSKPCFS
jgi:high-affinity Fe2+/Pb2+ permease